MKVLPNIADDLCLGVGHSAVSESRNLPPDDSILDESISISTTKLKLDSLLETILSKPADSYVSVATNKFRGGPSITSKDSFRGCLLNHLRQGWENPSATEARFIRLVQLVQSEGCAIFAGLIDTDAFEHLIHDFSDLMSGVGSQAFLHSFVNLVDHSDFIRNTSYNNAIIHPLMIALIAYAMGGPIRMIDARGKDTEPISVNAQDNMLHIDNTPFRQEYKILLGWERGKVKGPTGQNFTFLPGTHKGNRSIRLGGVNSHGQPLPPWSTEDDSLFITDRSIENIFQFQRDITGLREPKVVEVSYPDQPVTVLFSAGSLIHHRYRNETGNSRGCVITAFHLASDHPGVLIHQDHHRSAETLTDMLMTHTHPSETTLFTTLLSTHAQSIETTLTQITSPSHPSTLLDTSNLVLTGDKFTRWRETALHAPSATSVKFSNNHFLNPHPHPDSLPSTTLTQRIATAMSYDKHGLLDLIIYADGHEEIRKSARKSIYTMTREGLVKVVDGWIPLAVAGHRFALGDVEKPAVLKEEAEKVTDLMRRLFLGVDFCAGNGNVEQQLISTHQLIGNLGESITRCEKLETYSTTCLFLFLAVDWVISMLEGMECDVRREDISGSGVMFFRAYIASVLVAEKCQEI